MKHYRHGVILQRILKLVCCGAFILQLTGCGLKGPLYMPPENTKDSAQTNPVQQTLPPLPTDDQQE